MNEQPKFNKDEKSEEDIDQEIKDLFNEENEKGRELISNKRTKPKPNLDYYDNKKDKNFPYQGRFGHFKKD
jgi:hypothetical protein